MISENTSKMLKRLLIVSILSVIFLPVKKNLILYLKNRCILNVEFCE